jgi:glyceraldehyde 3-phosphate dehydrogenase
MAVRVGINGFGRIGRQSLKAILERHPGTIEVVAINDITDTATNAHLFRYDSTYGRFDGTVEVVNDTDLAINGNRIKVFAQKDPGQIPWGEVGAQLVIESTGFFTDADKARAHVRDTVKKVIISAPAKGEDITLVLSVNEDKYDPARHNIISNASCTTNGLAPVAKVLNDRWGIQKGLLTTIHSYTNSQRLLDVATKDLRDARAAALNIVPSTTGAARAVGLVIPELKGRFNGMSFRVPTPTVSVVDLTVRTVKETSYKDVCAAMKKASETYLKNILAYTDDEVVSSDFIHDQASSIFDAGSGIGLNSRFFKLVSWYDNEWGYSNRCVDLLRYMVSKG